MDKVEIINLAQKIGTYETSILPFEDCCTIFDPKNPVTKPTIKKAMALESLFDYETMIEDAITKEDVVVVKKKVSKEDYL